MQSNLLLRHDLLVLKKKSASGAAQVPATGAVVTVYVAGPRVHATTVLKGQSYDPRQALLGDLLQVGTTPAQLLVELIDGTTWRNLWS